MQQSSAQRVGMERLRRRADFVAASAAVTVPTAAFVLQARQREDDGPVRIGFTVSRKVGGAVERNRVRRRLKEVVRLSAPGRLRAGHDYVLVGRRAALSAEFDRMAGDLEAALQRIATKRYTGGRAAAQSGTARRKTGVSSKTDC